MEKQKPTYFLGIRGVHFIWHGEWADPELRYKKYVANYEDVCDSLWTSYKEECDEEGVKPSDDGWTNWCKKHQWRVKDDVRLFAES